MRRREFLKHTAVGSLAPALPTFLSQTVFAKPVRDDGRILVVIELAGGNDGINTVVPFHDDGYAQHRNELKILSRDIIKLTSDLAFHPRMRTASRLFQENRLSVVHGVGYPNPNRSHFESQRIWHVGSVSQEERDSANGWLGDAFSRQDLSLGPHAIHIGENELPIALRGRRCNAASISRTDDFALKLPGFVHQPPDPLDVADSDLASFVTQTVNKAYVSATELAEVGKKENNARYPGNRLSQRLRTIGQLIKMDTEARVFYTSQGGYDTHASQLDTHANLLGSLSSSLGAFMDDMKDAGVQDRVLVFVFSEFGRRVQENQSVGTDHGTAGPVFLCGTQLTQREYGKQPRLTDLEDGDLKHSMDFRNIYASVLTDWLGMEPPPALRNFGLENMFV